MHIDITPKINSLLRLGEATESKEIHKINHVFNIKDLLTYYIFDIVLIMIICEIIYINIYIYPDGFYNCHCPVGDGWRGLLRDGEGAEVRGYQLRLHLGATVLRVAERGKQQRERERERESEK